MNHCYKDLFDYISQHSGLNITDIQQLSGIYDSLLVETLHNKTLPAWTQDIFPGGKFDQLRRLSFSQDTADQELKKLKAGPFLSELVYHYDSTDAESNKTT